MKRFILKIVRNGLILAGIMFFSLLATSDFNSYEDWKPLIIFLGAYIFAELANYYHLNTRPTKEKQKAIKCNQTLIL